MIGSGMEIGLSIMLAAISVTGLTIAFSGWLIRTIGWAERALLMLGAVLAVWPVPVGDSDPLTLAVRAAGMGLIAVSGLRLTLGSHAAQTQTPHEPTSN